MDSRSRHICTRTEHRDNTIKQYAVTFASNPDLIAMCLQKMYRESGGLRAPGLHDILSGISYFFQELDIPTDRGASSWNCLVDALMSIALDPNFYVFEGYRTQQDIEVRQCCI